MSYAQTDSFCEISSFPFLGNKCKVTMDFGQYSKVRLTTSNQLIIEKDGSDKEFNTLIDALNFLVANGWEFVQAYSVDDSERFILKWNATKGDPFIPEIKGDLK